MSAPDGVGPKDGGSRRSPRAASRSPVPSSSGSSSSGLRGRGRPKKVPGASTVTPSSSPASSPRSLRSTRSSSVSSSGSKRERSRLAAAGGDAATCITRQHPLNLRCECCCRNVDIGLRRSSAALESCQQLWIRENCGQYQVDTHNRIVEWEREKTAISATIPDLVQTKEDKKKKDETASPAKKNHRARKTRMSQELSAVAASAAAAAAAGLRNFEPTASGTGSSTSRSTSISPPTIMTPGLAAAVVTSPLPLPPTPASEGTCPGMYKLTPGSKKEQLSRYLPYFVRAMRLTANVLAGMVKDMVNGATEAIQDTAVESIREYIRRGVAILPINSCAMDLSPGSLVYRSLSCVKGTFGGWQSRCSSCEGGMGATRKASGRAATPIQIPVPPTTPITSILEDMDVGRSALVDARKKYKAERRLRLQAEHELRMMMKGKYADGRTADGVILAMEEANKVIGNHYSTDPDFSLCVRTYVDQI